MYIQRNQIVEEIRLRKLIRRAITIVESKKQKHSVSDEDRLRSVIQTLVQEAKVGDTRNAPYNNTGLNTLNTLFDKILTQLEDGYKGLASGKEQRDSFAAHILVNVENALKPLMSLDDKDNSPLSEDIEIDIDSDGPEDMEDIRKDPEEVEKEQFTIPGQDLTGRDASYPVFKGIQTQIIDAYKTLHNPKDIEAFYDGLLMNLNMYFEQFEDEMSATVEKPEIETGVSPESDAPESEEDMDLEDIADM